MDSATPLLAEGSANTDVYGYGANGADHFATAYTDVVNHETPSGNWRDIQIAVDPVNGGWTYTDGFGATTSFPAKLDASHTVVLTTTAGTLSIVPVGAPADGAADGDTVTYQHVFDTADVVYRAMLDGVQDRIVLDQRPSANTFDYTLSAIGLSIAPNAYGGLDATSSDGTVVATIPAPVAYDAPPEHEASTGTYALTQHFYPLP